jgi:hypothetical protein
MSFVGVCEPVELFTNEQALSAHKSATLGTDAVDAALLARLLPLLDQLHPMDADLVELYYVRGCRQTDLAYMFGWSQPGIWYRIHRGVQRLQLLLMRQEIDEDLMWRDLDALPRPLPSTRGGRRHPALDVALLQEYWWTHSQILTGRALGYSQGWVRLRLIWWIRVMDAATKDGHPRTAQYAALFRYMIANRLLLHGINWKPGHLSRRIL